MQETRPTKSARTRWRAPSRVIATLAACALIATGGAIAPAIYGAFIGDGSSREPLFWGYLLGSGVMIAGGVIALVFGVDSARKGLEDITQPLSVLTGQEEPSKQR